MIEQNPNLQLQELQQNDKLKDIQQEQLNLTNNITLSEFHTIVNSYKHKLKLNSIETILKTPMKMIQQQIEKKFFLDFMVSSFSNNLRENNNYIQQYSTQHLRRNLFKMLNIFLLMVSTTISSKKMNLIAASQ
eukprot:TRINITY_DN6500_c0_g1_i2.p1 TRINITY_DN6500_c0_g1~~TRINITY_DN6500_c0_g1_i2.p1  ORF type:complete len:133 (-),score=22.27 TRINITY_DN6500_c0_g1_i2:293-691(-)